MTYQHCGKPDTQTNVVVTVQEQEGSVVVAIQITNGNLGGNKQLDHYALIMTGSSLLDWMADPEKVVFNGKTDCIL